MLRDTRDRDQCHDGAPYSRISCEGRDEIHVETNVSEEVRKQPVLSSALLGMRGDIENQLQRRTITETNTYALGFRPRCHGISFDRELGSTNCARSFYLMLQN